jgi:hypothetical protein
MALLLRPIALPKNRSHSLFDSDYDKYIIALASKAARETGTTLLSR